METGLAVGPAQFAEQSLGMTLPVISRVILRQLGSSNRIGLPQGRFKIHEARKVEIAAAIWHLMTRPNEDVVVAVPDGATRDAWLADVTTVLRQAQALTQREVAVYNGGLITRFLGPGKVRWHVSKALRTLDLGDVAGDRPLLIVCGIDDLPTSQALTLYSRFAPPATILASSYARR